MTGHPACTQLNVQTKGTTLQSNGSHSISITVLKSDTHHTYMHKWSRYLECKAIWQLLFFKRPVQWRRQWGWIWLGDRTTVWQSNCLRRTAVAIEDCCHWAEETQLGKYYFWVICHSSKCMFTPKDKGLLFSLSIQTLLWCVQQIWRYHSKEGYLEGHRNTATRYPPNTPNLEMYTYWRPCVSGER